jgi:two-component system, OmpR family, phosphate regulon sensor histidine kinase PhoR
MNTKPWLPTNVLVAAAVMAGVWFLARWGLVAALGDGVAAQVTAALPAPIAGVIASTGPYGSWGPIAGMVKAAQAMRDGDLSVRAPVLEKGPLAPLSHALNELAAATSRSADALKKELDLVSGIVDGMAEGVIVFDEDGYVVLANMAARRLAVSGDDILGKSAIEALRNAGLAEAVDRALTRGESGVREIETGGVLGRRLLVRTSKRAGKVGGVIAVLHDVTDLRRLETIRTEFVANVSHELRTPVTAITTAVETLLGGALDDPKDAAEFVEMIERNARRLRRLVDDILDLSKIEGKAYKLSPQVQDLLPIIGAARKLVEDAAGRRRMRVIVDAPAGLSAFIDRHAFEQVLGNLLDNAVKYAGEGASITVTARAEGDATVVSVSDTGAGIAPQHLDRLFERFYRVDTGRSREMGGTGLGLAIVKHLVEAMCGTIAVKSALGRGTTFTIHLSRVAKPQNGSPPPDSAGPDSTENAEIQPN